MEKGGGQGLKRKKEFALEPCVDFGTPGEGTGMDFTARSGGIKEGGMGWVLLENGLGAVDCGRQGWKLDWIGHPKLDYVHEDYVW